MFDQLPDDVKCQANKSCIDCNISTAIQLQHGNRKHGWENKQYTSIDQKSFLNNFFFLEQQVETVKQIQIYIFALIKIIEKKEKEKQTAKQWPQRTIKRIHDKNYQLSAKAALNLLVVFNLHFLCQQEQLYSLVLNLK